MKHPVPSGSTTRAVALRSSGKAVVEDGVYKSQQHASWRHAKWKRGRGCPLPGCPWECSPDRRKEAKLFQPSASFLGTKRECSGKKLMELPGQGHCWEQTGMALEGLLGCP